MKPLQLSTPTETTIAIQRSFRAPVPDVWRAFTEPDLVKRWLTGPPGHTMPVCEIDLRVGGRYRYVWSMPEGQMIATGTFREIDIGKRLLNTEVFDFAPDNETLVETLFSRNGDETIVTLNMHYDSKATRDAVLETPMEEGLEASYRNLDALVDATA